MNQVWLPIPRGRHSSSSPCPSYHSDPFSPFLPGIRSPKKSAGKDARLPLPRYPLRNIRPLISLPAPRNLHHLFIAAHLDVLELFVHFFQLYCRVELSRQRPGSLLSRSYRQVLLYCLHSRLCGCRSILPPHLARNRKAEQTASYPALKRCRVLFLLL